MSASQDEPVDMDPELDEGAGTGWTREPVDTGGGLGLKAWFKDRSRKKKEKKALRKGYVRWFLVSDAMSKPRFVKPECKEGGSITEFEYDGETYLFPEDRMVPSAEDGVWTVVHKKGQAEPLDLRSGNDGSLDAHSLHEYLTMRVTSEDPGGIGLPGLGNLSSKEIMTYGMMAIILFAILTSVL